MQRSYAKGGKIEQFNQRQQDQRILYNVQIPQKKTATFFQITDRMRNSNQNLYKIQIGKYAQQSQKINHNHRNDHSLSKQIDSITQRYNSNDKNRNSIYSVRNVRNQQSYTKYSNQEPNNRKKSSLQARQAQEKYKQSQAIYQKNSKISNGNQNIKIIEYQVNESPQRRSVNNRHDQNLNKPINFSRSQIPKININQGARLNQNQAIQNNQHHRSNHKINYGRYANQQNKVQSHSQQHIPSSKTINLNELDIESQCNSSSVGRGSSKQRGSFRHSHLQSHSNTSQVFKNILLQSHHLSAKCKVSQKKLAISIYLRQIFLRRTRYSFQLIRQFYDFGEQEQSEVSSMDQYTWLMYNDQKFHTLCKILQTKLLEDKLWAFLNLKYWQLFKNMRTFTIKIQTVTRKIQDRVNKLLKKDSFKTIFQYATQIANKRSETKASQPQTPIHVPKQTSPKAKEKTVIDSSRNTPNNGIYTTYVTTSTRRLTYEQYLKERQQRDRSRKKQHNSSLSKIRQQPEMGQKKSTITYVSRSNASVLSDENKGSKILVNNSSEWANSGATYVSNQTKAKIVGRESQTGKIRTIINSRNQKNSQSGNQIQKSSHVIRHNQNITQRKSIIDNRRVIYAGNESRVIIEANNVQKVNHNTQRVANTLQRAASNTQKITSNSQKVTSNAILNRHSSNSDLYSNKGNVNTNIYVQRRQLSGQPKNNMGNHNRDQRNYNRGSFCSNCQYRHTQNIQNSQSSKYGVRQQHHYYYYGVIPTQIARHQNQRLAHSRSIHHDDSGQGSVNRSYHYYCSHPVPGHTQHSYSPSLANQKNDRFRQFSKNSHTYNQEANRNYLKSVNRFNSPSLEKDSRINPRSSNRIQPQSIYRSRQDIQRQVAEHKNIYANSKTANRNISLQPLVISSQKNIYSQKDIKGRTIDKSNVLQQPGLRQQLQLKFDSNQQCSVCKYYQNDQSSKNSSISKRLKRQKNRMSSRRRDLSESRSNLSDHSFDNINKYCKHGKKVKHGILPAQQKTRAYYTKNSYQTTQKQRSDNLMPRQSNNYNIQQRIMYMRQLQSKNMRSQTKPFKVT